MDKIIREIHRNMIQNADYKDDIRQEIEKEIEKVLEEERKRMGWQEYEQCRDKMFSVIAIAEEEGFIKGFKYAAILMAECFQYEESTTEGF